MSSRVAAVDLRREEQTAVALSVELPRWIEGTLRERSVPIALNLDLVPEITVEAYPKALWRAIYDLVRNAMEAMGFEAENQQLSVSVRLVSDVGQAEIRIHNNGPAIPVEVQSTLFNDVYSSKGEERGIGLLFVRAAVEQMGGEVWLESSTEEEGTTFVVRLKVARDLNESEGELQ
jgi:signal transduction histidine kinase